MIINFVSSINMPLFTKKKNWHLGFHEQPITFMDRFHYTKGYLDFFLNVLHTKKKKVR